jgi:hypothetical protein
MKTGKRSVLVTLTVGCLILTVSIVGLSSGRAQAATQETCTVNGILWQTPISGVPNDLLLISCADGSSYNAYVGTPGGCFMDADTVKSWEALAMAARITGNTLTIWWNAMSCPGNAGSRIPASITMN